MSHTRRLLVLVVAWVAPLAWTATTLLAGPSDGTAITPSFAGLAAERWDEQVVVVRTSGDTPLLVGDVVRAIDGRTPADWLAGGDAPARRVGDVVAYDVRRTGTGSIALDLQVSVPLTRHPLSEALTANRGATSLAVMLLVAGSFAFWRRPAATSTRCFLAGASLGTAALTAYPLGLSAIDLAGSRGVWPHVAGEGLAALGLGLALLATATINGGPGPGRRWWAALSLLVPALGWGAWLLVDASQRSGVTWWRAGSTVLGPALVATVPVAVVVLARAYSTARPREDLQAARLALVGVGGGLGAWLVLGQVPQWLAGSPVLPWSVLVLVLVPAAVASLTIALARFRLETIEPTVRRAAVQLAVVALVGAAFVGLARAVDVASGLSAESMLVGGLVALALLPVAVGLQRGIGRLVYGDRALPRRVVSDLRHLDPTTSPEESLREMLALLARRLHLAHASVEVFATATSPAVTASTGTPVGGPVDVDLAVGGTHVGVLRLEVEPSRDPFGPADRLLLEDVGSQVGALVQAVTTNRELQRSRERLVAAREEERRRLRRDLHDGLGPSLASLAMRLEAAQDLIAEDPERASEVVGRLSEQARDEIGEVRRLVDGLRPPALDQLGLVSALRQRAEVDLPTAGAATRRRTVVTIDAGDDVEPLPAAVEVAAYRIALEAVTNAQRHSGAASCRVEVRRERDALRLRVVDDGRGLAEDRVPGVGLFSMRERAQELGGTCSVTSGEGGGTVVEAVLPIGSGGEREG